MDYNYSKDELDVLENIENGNYVSIQNLENAKDEYSQYAKNTYENNRNISIQISERDLNSLQMQALEEGIPYQTFITSLLHKYINGRLIDVNVKKKIYYEQ